MSAVEKIKKAAEVLNQVVAATKDYAENQRRVFARVSNAALRVRKLAKVATHLLGKNDEEGAAWQLREVDNNWLGFLEEGVKLPKLGFEAFKRQAGQERAECHIIFSVWPFITRDLPVSDFPTPDTMGVELVVYLAALQDVPGELSKTISKFAHSAHLSAVDLLKLRERAHMIAGMIEDNLLDLSGITEPTLSVFSFRGGRFYDRMRQVENATLRFVDGILDLQCGLEIGDESSGFDVGEDD